MGRNVVSAKLDMLDQTNVPVIQKAVKVIYDMSEDTKIRELARLREKALHDEASLLQGAKDEGRAEGRAEGIKEGLEEGREEIISKMRRSGLSEEEINRILNT